MASEFSPQHEVRLYPSGSTCSRKFSFNHQIGRYSDASVKTSVQVHRAVYALKYYSIIIFIFHYSNVTSIYTLSYTRQPFPAAAEEEEDQED